MMEYYCDITDNLNQIKKVLADGAYAEKPFANTIKFLSGAKMEVAKRNKLHTFAVILKRWMIECTFVWLDNYRRLWKNCERDLQNTFQLITIAFIRLFLKGC